jgi:beta-N-acetylhexosaminidase
MLNRTRVAAGALCTVAAVLVAACGGASGAPETASVTSSSGSSTDAATTVSTSTAVAVSPLLPSSPTARPTPTPSSTASPTSVPEAGTSPVEDSLPATSPPPPATATAQPVAPSQALIVTDADRARAAAIVAGMSPADRAASVLMVMGREAVGTGLLTTQHVGGVILFAQGGAVDGTANGTPAQVAAVTAALRADAATDPAGVPPLIATDQEYGLVQRLKNGFTTFPRAAELGAIADVGAAAAMTRRVATAAAQEMRAVGVSVDFAPVFGVLPAGGGPSAIGQYGRSYGSDPHRVATLVAAAVTGYQSGGVIAGMKHFPGLARIGADSHVTLPTLSASCADWNAHEAIPAKAGIDAGALMVMTGHVLLPAAGDGKRPASVSPVVVQQLLKGSGAGGCTGMGFDGVTVTDSMQMAPITDNYGPGAAAVQALAAGEDLVLMSANPAAAVAGIVAAVRDGSLEKKRLDDAATAVLALRIASARVPAPPLDVVNSAAHRSLAAAVFAAAK